MSGEIRNGCAGSGVNQQLRARTENVVRALQKIAVMRRTAIFGVTGNVGVIQAQRLVSELLAYQAGFFPQVVEEYS